MWSGFNWLYKHFLKWKRFWWMKIQFCCKTFVNLLVNMASKITSVPASGQVSVPSLYIFPSRRKIVKPIFFTSWTNYVRFSWTYVWHWSYLPFSSFYIKPYWICFSPVGPTWIWIDQLWLKIINSTILFIESFDFTFQD